MNTQPPAPMNTAHTPGIRAKRIASNSIWNCPVCGNEYSGHDSPQICRRIRDDTTQTDLATLLAQRNELRDALKAISEVQPSHDDAFSTLRLKLEGCRDLAVIALANAQKP